MQKLKETAACHGALWQHPNFRNLPVVEGKKWKTQEWHLKVPSRPSICIIENITINSRVWMWQNHTSLWIWTCYKMLETSLIISAFARIYTRMILHEKWVNLIVSRGYTHLGRGQLLHPGEQCGTGSALRFRRWSPLETERPKDNKQL